jgi:hydrogenase expression/formation protein HypD
MHEMALTQSVVDAVCEHAAGRHVHSVKVQIGGEVLKGVIKPWECKVFGTACTPETPIGTCMVSPEGACAAYYNFGRLHRETAQLLGQRG